MWVKFEDVLKKGTGGWKKAVGAFGEDILLPSGEVDTSKLGHIVFSDPAKRQLLNRLLATYISSGIFHEVLKLWLKGYEKHNSREFLLSKKGVSSILAIVGSVVLANRLMSAL
ncbi:hypothetical protein Droror1_Dr00003962 [Drosera rotundifolia]